MKDLIEALQIFAKYTDADYPTHCEHDILIIMEVDQAHVMPGDNMRLYELGFRWNTDYKAYTSYRFGSA